MKKLLILLTLIPTLSLARTGHVVICNTTGIIVPSITITISAMKGSLLDGGPIHIHAQGSQSTSFHLLTKDLDIQKDQVSLDLKTNLSEEENIEATLKLKVEKDFHSGVLTPRGDGEITVIKQPSFSTLRDHYILSECQGFL